MTRRRCSRLWVVEAVRDGRVKGDERMAFDRHVRTCKDCADERLSLDQLREALQHLPSPVRDPLSERRQLQRLMAAFEAESLAPARQWRPRATMTWAALALAAVTVASAARRASRSHAGARVERPAPETTVVDVRPDPGGRWHQTDTTVGSRVDLLDGSFSVRIKRSSREARVVIGVPDGEIEDFGTVLSITVKHGRTLAISVAEGEVAVRVHALSEFRLRAGDAFVVPDPPVDSPSASSTLALPLPQTAPSSPHRSEAGAKHSGTTKVEESRHGVVEPIRKPQPPLPDQLLLEGQMAQDEAYLEVIRLLRAGRDADAHEAAAQYLVRFPAGFRRAEMLDVAGRRADH